MGRRTGDEEDHLPLYETKEAKRRLMFKLYVLSVFVGICGIMIYRATHIPREKRWLWIGMLGAELWFAFYWILTLSVRWKPVYRRTFRERLAQRHERDLPCVDIFVCTADPIMEPPTIVINTVLSVMAYNYPPEKLGIYLSDDGGSDLTFYALVEASRFSKQWIPFCKKFKVEPRSPKAYFSTESCPQDRDEKEWFATKELYEEMEKRIEMAVKLGRIPQQIREEQKGFSQWNSKTTPRDHQAIVEVLIGGEDSKDVDIEGFPLPTLVYLAREKRPQHPHNFKAGAMNALIRVSSEISNGQIILNVDCDMYSNNSESVRDALCFFMDKESGHKIGYVQFPQNYNNVTKNDLYSNTMRTLTEVDFPGLDGFGGPLYIGSGCFHRRKSLCGSKFDEELKGELKGGIKRNSEESTRALEKKGRILSSCSYEENTEWGKEMGLKYGCPVEDVITGLSIQCRGWKSIYFNPTRIAYLGIAPTTLGVTLVQQKRWSEGDFQIFFSKYCPFIYGYGTIKVGLRMAYSIYCLWAPNSLPTLYYIVIPSLCLLHGVSVFPRFSNPWTIPFVFVFIATYAYDIGEMIYSGGTVKAWWNAQRMWMFRRTTSYLFAFVDTILKQLGFAKSAFTLTTKVTDDEAAKRYEKEIMEFGSSSSMFGMLATLALVNLLCLVGGVKRVVANLEVGDADHFLLQVLLCGLLVIINRPLYQGLFFRTDNGRMPITLTFASLCLAILITYLAPLF